jgi:signal transduction histidine kinase
MVRTLIQFEPGVSHKNGTTKRFMNSPRILVVGAQLTAALSLSEALKSSGYEVVDIADSPEEALTKVIQWQPNLILMDIRLQGRMDGITTTEKIQQRWPIPVIYLNAPDNDQTLERVKKTNAYGYLVQPFKLSDLLAAIEIAVLRVNHEAQIKITKSQSLTNISHEIRTPMNAILGFCQILKYEVKSSLLQSYLNAILDNGNSLMNLLNDILELARLELGEIELVQQEVNLLTLLQEIQQFFQEKAEKKSLNLRIEIPDDSPNILFDRVSLRQILVNIIDNAIKFTNQGEVKVKVAVEQIAHEQLQSYYESSFMLILTVEDTGIGIDKEQKKHIFEAFFQVDGSISRRYPGIGLGLAVVWRLTQRLGGYVEVFSQLNQGSTFRVSFPNVEVFPRPSTFQDNPRRFLSFNTEEIPPELEAHLPELLNLLQAIELGIWDKASHTFVLRDLREFVEELQILGTAYPYPGLVDYTTRLSNELEVLSGEFFETFAAFPQLVRELETKF